MTTYFVDATNGNDGHNGQLTEDAWQSINKINNTLFNPGDEILFKRGETWHEALFVPNSGTADNPIIFGAYGIGAAPIISGDNARYGCIRLTGQSNIIISDLTLEKPTGAGIYSDGSCDNVQMLNLEIRGFGSSGISFMPTGAPTNIVVDGCTIHNGLKRGVHMIGVGAGCVVRNCTIYDVSFQSATTFGIDIDGFNSAISGAIVENNRVYNIDVGGSSGAGIDLENCIDAPIVRNNIISNCSKYGIGAIAYQEQGNNPDYRGELMNGKIHNNLIYNINNGIRIIATAG